MTASGRIAYSLPDGTTDYGFMVAGPIARQEVRDSGAPDGFVVGFFRIRELAKEAISRLEPRGVEVDANNYTDWWTNPLEPKVAESVRVADRRLAIICGRTRLFRSAEAFQQGPWMVLVAGLVFTMFLSFYLARVRENNRERTAMQEPTVW